jgi:hypothetical protein
MVNMTVAAIDVIGPGPRENIKGARSGLGLPEAR